MTTVAHRPDREHSARRPSRRPADVLLAAAESWGVTLRVALLIGIPIAAIVLVVLILGPTGIGIALAAGGVTGGGQLLWRRTRGMRVQ